MITNSMWSYGGGFATGAEKTTLGKPLYDGDIDKIDSSFPAKIRKQNKWLNVNTTDIPTAISSFTSKTIGSNINIQAESKSKTFNAQFEELFEDFKKIGVGELTNKHHFNSAMRAISDFDLLDGGILVRHHYNAAWTIPYKYELVGVDMIDVSKCSGYFEKEDTTIAGIVLNKWNQITHLWIYDENKTKSTKIKIENFTYYSDTWVSIGQQVAISRLSSMLSTLDKTHQYSNAELEAAIEEAKAGHYVKSSVFKEVVGRAINKIDQDFPNAFDKQIAEFQTILKGMNKLGVGTTGLTPIPSEDEIVFNSTKRDGVYNDLNDNSEMKNMSSIGLSDLGAYKKAHKANYSALKYTAETDQLSADIRFDNISNKIVNNIMERLAQVGVQIGRISDRVSYWKNPSKFHKFRYIRKNKIDIEPAKNATADKTNIANGTDTEADIVERKHGVKYEVWLDKNLEKSKLKASKKIELEVFEIKLREEAFKKAKIDLPEEGEESNKKDTND